MLFCNCISLFDCIRYAYLSFYWLFYSGCVICAKTNLFRLYTFRLEIKESGWYLAKTSPRIAKLQLSLVCFHLGKFTMIHLMLIVMQLLVKRVRILSTGNLRILPHQKIMLFKKLPERRKFLICHWSVAWGSYLMIKILELSLLLSFTSSPLFQVFLTSSNLLIKGNKCNSFGN